MAVLGWDDPASAGEAIAGAIERYYTTSLRVLAHSQEPYYGESPNFALSMRILIEHEIGGTESEGGVQTSFGLIFNPDFVGWLRWGILLGIDWKRVVALEV